MLADFEIRKAQHDGYINIAPCWNEEQLQPVSYDLLLSEHVRFSPHPERVGLIDPKGLSDRSDMIQPNRGESYMDPGLIPATGYTLKAGEFLLACTQEEIGLSPHIAARVEGKSSLGRLGVQVHITAGFIDPGFVGQITLEIANVAPWAVVLYPGMPIAQIVFEQVSMPEKPYNVKGHYCGQHGPTEARYSL